MKITDNGNCRICHNEEESITHLFTKCNVTQILWQQIQEWIHNKVGINVTLLPMHKILGYTDYNDNYTPLNFLLIVTGNYIFTSALNNLPINIFALQNKVKAV